LHRGGPVATGSLEGDTLICPWHGYRYNLPTGTLTDPKAKLGMYPVEVRSDEIYLSIPVIQRDSIQISIKERQVNQPDNIKPKANEFLVGQLNLGQTQLVHVNSKAVAVYNVDGQFFATQDNCTHAGGPLSEGFLEGKIITCPWHGSCFDVTNGQVTCGPATEPVKTYRVTLEGDLGRVEVG
jgi:nitrite reductase/ring-hydroxylating ferredoxin subunit